MKNSTHKIEQFDDHIIVLMDGLNVLIDTGSPSSMAKIPNFTYNGIAETLSSSLLGMTDIYQIEKLLGHPVDVLLGADLLARHPVKIDLKKKLFSILDDNFSADGATVLPFQQTMGGVTLNIELNGIMIPAILDSGAKISYISAENPVSREFAEVRTDFHPMIGSFETRVGEVPVRIAGIQLIFTFGILPDMFDMLLRMIDVPNILGSDLFKNFVVVIDYTNNRLLLWENEL